MLKRATRVAERFDNVGGVLEGVEEARGKGAKKRGWFCGTSQLGMRSKEGDNLQGNFA